jgi:hypothetical protein
MEENKIEIPNGSSGKTIGRYWLHVRGIVVLLIGIGFVLWGVHDFIRNKFALFEKASAPFNEFGNPGSEHWDLSEPLWVMFFGLLICFCAAGDYLWHAILKNRHNTKHGDRPRNSRI